MKKRVLSLLLTMAMMVSLLPTAFAAKQPTFTDVSKDMWFYDYVEFVAEKGYFKGTTVTTFDPNGNMTRQQFVTVLARMVGEKVDNSVTAFPDVPAGSYSAGSVTWAVKEGIVNGYPDGTFKPNDPITREQMSTLMSRFMDYYEEEHGARFVKKGTVSSFVDYSQISAYAKDAVDRCRTYGLIEGYAEDNTFRPASTATRAQVAAVITRLENVLRFSGGGGGGGGAADYVLTYTNSNAKNEADRAVSYEQDEAEFTVVGEPDCEAANDKLVFLNWTDGMSTYVENDTYTITSEDGEATLDAVWANPDDLLYMAVGQTVKYVNEKADAKLPVAADKYAALNSVEMSLANPTADDAGREIVMSVSASLESSAIIIDTAQTVTYYAINLLGGVADDEVSVVTMDELTDIVEGVLNVLDPDQVWFQGAGRREVIKNIAVNVISVLKEKGSLLWNNYYKYDGKTIISEVAVKNGGNTLLVVKGDKNLYNADGSKLSAVSAVARVAKAAASQMYNDLQAKYAGEKYVYDLELTAALTLDFTMSSDAVISKITAPFSTEYNVAATVSLDQQSDILGYRYDKAEDMNYAQLTITSVMQAQYNENIEEIAKTVVTNEKLAATLESTMKSMMTSMIKSPAAGSPIDELLETLMDYDEEIEADLSNKAKAADYVLDALLPAVELWTEANLTAEETPDGAPYYLPFDFFWYKSGTVNADGTLMRPSGPVADRVLGNNEDLVDAVEGLIDEVINAVAAPIFDEYEEKYGIDFDDFENSIDKLLKDKINEKLDDATVAELQDEVVGTAASEMGTLKSTMNAEAKKVVKKAAMLEGATEAEFDLAWSMMSPAEQDAEIKKYMDVDALLVELFGTADSAALTVDHIDAAATYQAKPYDADVQSKINKATSAADLQKLMPDFKEMIKDETSEMLYETINTKVESKLAELISGNEMVAEMLGDDNVSRTYVKALVLNKMGFDSFIDVNVELSSGKTMKDQALANMADAIDKKINDAIEEERNAIITAEEVEDMLNGAVAEACGTYSEYLNKIGLINNFASLREDKLEELVWLLRDDMFLNLVGKVGAPQYVTKLGDVIAKLDSTGAVVKIAGKQVSGAVLDDVKTAGNVKELCVALADFLEIFEDMSINSFEEGVLVEVNDEQITLVLNIQK